MQLSEFHRVVDFVLPPATAMPGDNIGLQVSSVRGTAQNVLVCLEVTDGVLREADALRCDAILTFHPLIYAPISHFDLSDRVSRLVSELIRRDIALLCVHTAFDAFPQGTNHVLAKRLGLQPLRPLDESGMGLIASAPSMTFDSFIDRVVEVCGSPVRFVSSPVDVIHTVAIVSGSGMSWFDHAVAQSVDVFLTADVKYHAFHAASGVVGLVDPGHFEMEQFVPEAIVETLRPHVQSQTSMRATSVITNPARWSVPIGLRSDSLTPSFI